MSRTWGVVVWSLAALGLMACTTTQIVKPYQGGPLPRPDRIIVNAFACSPSEVKLTRGIAPEVERALSGSPRSAEELEVCSKVANVLADQLVSEIRGMGLLAVRGYGDPGPLGDTYSIDGQFLSVDEGNRTERDVIGLGFGRTDVRTLAQLYHDWHDGRFLVEAIDVSAKSGRKPGMAETMGVGGLTGNLVAAAAVSAAGTVGSEIFAASVEADARRTATALAQKLEPFFQEQGWITQ